MCKNVSVSDFSFNWPYSCLNNVRDCQWPCELEEFFIQMAPFVAINRFLLFYGTLFLIFMGTILNCLSFYVILSSGLSKKGSGLYLLTLAVADTSNLLFNYGVGILRAKVPHANAAFMDCEFLCRVHGVCVEVFQTASAWIVVGLTAERCAAVWFPLLLRSRKKRISTSVIIGVSISSLLFSLTKLFVKGFEGDSVFGYAACGTHGNSLLTMKYIRVALETWIPTFLVISLNLAIFLRLRKVQEDRIGLTELRRDINDVNAHRPVARVPSASASPMLFAVSLAYIVFVFPLGVVQTVELSCTLDEKLLDGESRNQYIERMKMRITLKLVRSLCFALYQLNFSINFFLYYASGTQFRGHLKNKITNKLRMAGFVLFRRFSSSSSGSSQGHLPTGSNAK